MQRLSALIQEIGDVPHRPGFLAELRAALISGECPLEAHDDARTDTHGLLCTAQLSATSMDDLLGDCAGLRDELSSGPKDCFVMLKAACMLVEHHPQVYGGGDGADVGSVLLVLVPALADSRLCGAHDLIVKTIYQLVQLIVQSSEPAPVRLFFEDLADLLAASLEGPDARSHHDDTRCLKRIAALVEREGKSGASSERARMEDSWVRLQLPFARNQLSDKIVSTMLLILPGCAHLLAHCTRPIWNLACRTVLNTPHAQCIKLFELLACLCEHYQAPAIWGDKLCQTLVWSIRYQNRLAPPGAAAKPNKDLEGKPQKECVMEHARMLDSVAQSLARCINAAFHTIPAAVRHVHAENWVSWALEYLEVQPSRNINLSRALLSTLATNVSDCPSLVPNIMRLSGLMHDIQLQDAISTCLKRVFSVLLVSPAHGNVLLSFLRGRTENAVSMGTACGAWAVQSESSQDRVMKDATSEHGRGKKRHRVLEGADLTASKRQSFNGSQSASTMSAGNAASDNLASTVFEELLTKFLQACLLSKGAESAPESDLNLQAAVQQRGLLSAMCVASEFSRENKQSTGAPVGRVSHTIARTIFQFINMIASQTNAVAKIAADGNLVLFLQSLCACCNSKVSTQFSAQLCSIIEGCIAVCSPLLAVTSADMDEKCRSQLIHMIKVLSSSARLPTSNAPTQFFFEVLRSSDETIAIAAMKYLPGFVLRCPAAAARANDWITVLHQRLEAASTTITMKILIPRTLSHLVCAVCALQSCSGDMEKAIRCEVQATQDAYDPIEHFVAKQSLFSDPRAGGGDRQTCTIDAHRGVWCCNDRCGARYGSVAQNHHLPLPFAARVHGGADRRKQGGTSREIDRSTVSKLASSVFELFEGVIKAAQTGVNEEVLSSVLSSLSAVSLHLSSQRLKSECWLLECLLQIVTGHRCKSYNLRVRCCAAAAIAGLASGNGRQLMAISGEESFHRSCGKVIDRVREVFATLELDEPLKAAGCIQVEAFLGCLIDDRRGKTGALNILQMICTDLVNIAVQSLSTGEFRNSSRAYGALEFIAVARGLTVDGLIAHSQCREDVIVQLIKSLQSDGDAQSDGRQDVRMLRAYVNLFGDSTGKGVGSDDDECCKRFLEVVFKDVAHKLLLEDGGQLIECVARFLQLEPSVLIADNLQFIIKNIFFANARDGMKQQSGLMSERLKQFTQMDAMEATRDQPICADHLLEQVLWEVSQYVSEADKKSGRDMVSKLCRWLLSEDRRKQGGRAEEKPLEVILSMDKYNGFYTKWMHNLTQDCFENTKMRTESQEMHEKRKGLLMAVDFTVPLLGRQLDQMLAVILTTLNKAKLFEDVREKLCEVWYTLIFHCGYASKVVRSRLPQIVMTLLQLGGKYPQKVKPSLKLLLVDWRDKLKDEYKKIPEESVKSEELKEFTDFLAQVRMGESDTLPSLLALSIDGIQTADDNDVQVAHLTMLQNSIQAQFQVLLQTLSGITSKDLETQGKLKVAELIRLLLAKCTSPHMKVRQNAALCLGQLSAIEPSRIPPVERLVQHAEQSDDDLAIEIINEHIVRMLMGSSSRRNSSAAGVVELALQEILKFLEIDKLKDSLTSPAQIFRHPSTQYSMSQQPPTPAGEKKSTSSKRGSENWSKIRKDAQTIIVPWLTTSLQISDTVTHDPKHHIFRIGMNYENWVRNFSHEVVMRCQGPRGELLKMISKMLRKDYDLANFVLSPAVLHLICTGEEADMEFIVNELLSVLRSTNSGEYHDEGDVIEKIGADSFKIRSTAEKAPMPDELLGMELRLVCNGWVAESRNIKQAELDQDRMVRVHVFPPFSDALKLETSAIRYSIAKGDCSGSHSEKIEGSTQLVFKILDDLTEQLESCLRTSLVKGRNCPQNVTEKKQVLQRFLKKIPRMVLASASCKCAAYDRALLYLETSIRDKWQLSSVPQRTSSDRPNLPPPLAKLLNTMYTEPEKEEVLSTFHQIYAGLEDDDGLMGISTLRKEISLSENITACELGGDWNQALACYEQSLKQSPCASAYIDYLQCLRNLGHMQAMLTQAQAEIVNYPFHAHEFRASALQAAWRIGRWDLVEEHLAAAQNNADFGNKPPFENQLASVLLAMQQHDQQSARRGIMPLLHCVLKPLAAASMESYQRAYPHMIRLHMVTEIQRSFRVIFPTGSVGAADTQGMGEQQRLKEIEILRRDWDMRLELTQPSMGEREPLLALRRSLFAIMGARDAVAAGWLEFAKSARRAGHASTANSAILQAESLGEPMAFLERAKLQWCHDHERHQAINSLRTRIDLHLLQLQDSSVSPQQGETAAAALKGVTLYWKWVQEIGLQQTSEVIAGFEKDLSKLGVDMTNIEKTHFMLGQLYESLAFPHRNSRPEEMMDGGFRSGNLASTTHPNKHHNIYLAKVLEKYGASLKCGHKHIFQSLPRLLTLWFENIDCVDEETKLAMHHVISRLTTELPSYIWLTVYPQLISRICHKNLQVLEILKGIIARVLAKHPRQALWALAAVIRSKEQQRMKPAMAILAKLDKIDFFDGDRAARKAAQEDFMMAKKAFLGGVEGSGGFAGELVGLCRITLGVKDSSQDKKRVYTMSKDCRNLVRSVRELPNQIIMPVESMLVPSLPRDGKTDRRYRPFPADEIYIKGFGDAIDVMQSMMSPVKVHFLGSDGQDYKFLAKPKDDLRKDTRMMEFNTMINRLLVKDADARRRNLHLRTFTVIPMNESTGIIQWVDNTEVFRSIIDNQVAKLMHKNFHSTTYARQVAKNSPEGMLTLDAYLHLIETYQPVFHRWFQEKFSDPASWTAARNTYVRTTAAWSMVGYVVGLGDRHTENILFDSTSGACVHVDFACMFNKGESLKVKERVPFRLTHNMVDAMGVAGYGGSFTRTCCHTMRVLRANRSALMNVLETCVHDPLVEFVRKGDEGRLQSCERRLHGEVTRYPHERDIRQVLSVEGQVESVVAEAVSPQNLHLMYRWWMPWY